VGEAEREILRVRQRERHQCVLVFMGWWVWAGEADKRGEVSKCACERDRSGMNV